MRSAYALMAAAVCATLSCSERPGRARSEKPEVANAGLQTPEYSAASIAPSGATGPGPLAPGRVVSIYGAHLGPIQPCHGAPAPTGREVPNPLRPNQTTIETQVFPNKLCDTDVQVGGVSAGLLYVSAGQVNFKVPQAIPTEGETVIQVRYKGQAGPSIPVPLTTDAPNRPAEQIAAIMWSQLEQVRWQREYTPNSDACASIPPHPNLRGGLFGHAFYCASTQDDVIAESLYYPEDHTDPRIRLMRADIRPVGSYPELSAEIERLLVERLTKAYGPGVKPGNLYEIGAQGRESGLLWRSEKSSRSGEVAVFLHRNRTHVHPVGVRQGVILIAVRQELLNERENGETVDEQIRLITSLSQPAAIKEMEQQLPGMFFPEALAGSVSEQARAELEKQTRTALLRLLRLSAGPREKQAAALVAADDLARRLGSLLVARSVNNGSEILVEAKESRRIRIQLASHGVRYGDIGHYGDALTYDHALLKRAWSEYPDTSWGQRAFLMLQRLGCATPLLGCDGPNCFRAVIEQGNEFLQRYPETRFRKEQIYHLALANDTWWSLANAQPGDITAEGARVTKATAERARQTAIRLYEELLAAAPRTPEAHDARVALPRLKLKLDTGERAFFCFAC